HPVELEGGHSVDSLFRPGYHRGVQHWCLEAAIGTHYCWINGRLHQYFLRRSLRHFLRKPVGRARSVPEPAPSAGGRSTAQAATLCLRASRRLSDSVLL